MPHLINTGPMLRSLTRQWLVPRVLCIEKRTMSMMWHSLQTFKVSHLLTIATVIARVVLVNTVDPLLTCSLLWLIFYEAIILVLLHPNIHVGLTVKNTPSSYSIRCNNFRCSEMSAITESAPNKINSIFAPTYHPAVTGMGYITLAIFSFLKGPPKGIARYITVQDYGESIIVEWNHRPVPLPP